MFRLGDPFLEWAVDYFLNVAYVTPLGVETTAYIPKLKKENKRKLLTCEKRQEEKNWISTSVVKLLPHDGEG